MSMISNCINNSVKIDVFKARPGAREVRSDRSNSSFLSKLDNANIEHRSFRNQWILVVILKAKGKEFSQPMPPLRKTEFMSPLLAKS